MQHQYLRPWCSSPKKNAPAPPWVFAVKKSWPERTPGLASTGRDLNAKAPFYPEITTARWAPEPNCK